MRFHCHEGILRFEGATTLDPAVMVAILRVNDEPQPGLDPAFPLRLIDFRQVSSLNIPSFSLFSLAELRKKQNPHGRSAILYSTPEVHQAAREWIKLVEGIPLQIALFEDEPAALAWLRSPRTVPPPPTP